MTNLQVYFIILDQRLYDYFNKFCRCVAIGYLIALPFQEALLAQSIKQKDSVEVFNLINEAEHHFAESAYDSALYYSEKAEILAKQKGFQLGMAYAKIKKGEIYIDFDDLDKAGNTIAQLEVLGDKLGNPLVIAITTLQKAQVKMYQDNIPEALALFKSCTENYFENHPSAYAALAYNDYGYAFGLNGQLTEKAQMLFKALAIHESLPELDHSEIAVAYNNISTVYYELGQREKAIQYAKKSIEHRQIAGDIDRLALGYCNLSQMYRSVDVNECIKYQKLCVEYAEKSGNQDRIIHAYITSALLESDAGNRETAIEFEKKTIAILEQNPTNLGMLSKRYLALGMHYKSLNKDKALTLLYLNKALEISKSNNDKITISEAYNQLSDYFSSQNNYKEALNSQKNYYVYRDSIFKENTNSAIADLETKYETEKKEKEISVLTAKNELSQQQKKIQTYLFIGILCLGLFMGGFLFYSYRNKLKTAQKLKELNDLKSRFFANISHEFRTPLTLIKSPLQLLKTDGNTAEQAKHLAMIEQHSDRMLSLVDQLLQLSKIDSGQLKLLLQESPLFPFLETLVEPFNVNATNAGFIFKKSIEKTPQLYWFDKDVIEKIITNLLSNALKYSPQGKSISFGAKIENDELQITVKNTAGHLETKDVSRLFERFYQDKQNSEGVGIGLALVKELVTLYKGDITAILENQILTFHVKLPLNKEQLKEVSIITKKNNVETILQNSVSDFEELPILLVVDDNADIRLVLKNLFQKKYHVLEAIDGVSGLKIAMNEIPDIIISDVTMPNMDGFELIEALKYSEVTSSIPIILLTAKTSDESRLKGLQHEADDYITKPFNHEILMAKVQQLIETRHKLRERYSKELVLKPTDIAITSADEKFIACLQGVIDKELTNTDFSVDDFAKTVGMSRMQLHRKLKTLLGVSATEFLRNERLKAAAILLKKGAINVSEIAYQVGFNDVSYFSKCFRETFGMTPTEFAGTP